MTGEVIASILSVISMMIAIRRRDDGPLTSVFSFIGWSCIFTSRILVFSILSSCIHAWISVIIILHTLLFATWIYRMSLESFETAPDQKPSKKILMTNITIFFALPSLFYWPIMFDLKEHQRPVKFLIITMIENVLFEILFIICSGGIESISKDLWILLITSLILSFIGSLCILMYTCFKPSLTDQVVLFDTKIENKNSYGIYFEFCELIFKLPSLEKVSHHIKDIRGEKIDKVTDSDQIE